MTIKQCWEDAYQAYEDSYSITGYEKGASQVAMRIIEEFGDQQLNRGIDLLGKELLNEWEGFEYEDDVTKLIERLKGNA